MLRRSTREKGPPPDSDIYEFYGKHSVANAGRLEHSKAPSQLSLPLSPTSWPRSSISRSSSSSKRRRLVAQAELDAATALEKLQQEEAEFRLKLEREESERRLESRRRLITLQLATAKAEIDETFSVRSSVSDFERSSVTSDERGLAESFRSPDSEPGVPQKYNVQARESEVGCGATHSDVEPVVTPVAGANPQDVGNGTVLNVDAVTYVPKLRKTAEVPSAPLAVPDMHLEDEHDGFVHARSSMNQESESEMEKALRRQMAQQREEFRVREKAYELHLQQAEDRERMARRAAEDGNLPVTHVMADMAKAFTEALQTSVAAVSAPPTNQADSTAMQHFMARQTVGKELPLFSGQPEEWPVFVHLFQLTTKQCQYTDSENIVRLQRSLRGKAKEAVSAMLTLPENVSSVMETLELRFGRPDLVVTTLIGKAKAHGNIKSDDFDGLISFSTAVQTLVSTMKLMQADGHMYNPQLRQELVLKLPPSLRMQWGEVVRPSAQRPISLNSFASWLSERAAAASCVQVARVPVADGRSATKKVRSETTLATSESPVRQEHRPCLCAVCNGRHSVDKCNKFLALTTKQRYKWVKSGGLCFSCLSKEHVVKDCGKKSKCGLDGCEMSHHKLLHRQVNTQSEASPPQPSLVHNATADLEESVVMASAQSVKSGHVLLRVLPVVLQGPLGDVVTHALLDEASTVSLLDASLAAQLGVSGPLDPLSLKWTNAITQVDKDSQRVEVRIRGVDSEDSFVMSDVRTRKNLSLPAQALNMAKFAKKWPHLDDITFPVASTGGPRLLIGQDQAHLIVAREVIEGPCNAPMASLTKLGWVVHGNVSAHAHSRSDAEFVLHTWEGNGHDALHQLVKDSFSTENFGVKLCGDSVKPESVARAEKLLAGTTCRVGNRFETGLLWKDDSPELPSNYSMALKRLSHMERKMDKEPAFAEQYTLKIADYVRKGYARQLSIEEAAECPPWTWYLPHFAVFNINKPGKLRFVFDASARVGNVSLNTALLPGPDLLNSLIGVLIRFRQHAVAFGGDVMEMFHQVLIRQQDQPAQRFLWRGSRRQGPPDIYVMQAMTFGCVSSPASAQFVMRHNANEFARDFPDVAEAVTRKYYMDDYFDSTNTVEEAVQRVSDMIEVQQRGGFKIRNWVSSSQDVLRSVPADLRAHSDIDFNTTTELPVERTLGLRWNPNNDCFVFAVHPSRLQQISDPTQPVTKRSVLSHVMSVFDPLGFLSAFTMSARVLLQDIWISGIGWDDELPSNLASRWQTWCQELLTINQFSLPRCYAPSVPNGSLSLHVFCDASTKAFAAVSYLRVESCDRVVCAFVASKVRVAPLKPMSVPRLELQAAVLGVRLAQILRKEHDIQWQSVMFWTDSRTVLQWIRSDARQFKPFVAHRVGEILETSTPVEWRWVPTRLNVADDATRGLSITDLQHGRWQTGPEFLCLDRSEWPEETASDEVDDSALVEVKSQYVGVTVKQEDLSQCLPDPSRFSSYLRLVRATVWVMRFVKNLLARRNGTSPNVAKQLLVSEYRDAEVLWWKQVQKEAFSEELADLTAGRPVSANSRLRQLSPGLDDEGVIRLEGRIDLAVGVPCSAKRPVVIPPNHDFTRLLIHHHHILAGHHGQATVLNELRQRVWVLNGRAAVRRSWTNCQFCKNQRSLPAVPIMAGLPKARLTPTVRPFSTCGMDYFGPMDVRIGRRTEKRYGVLFTCMVTRAVHS